MEICFTFTLFERPYCQAENLTILRFVSKVFLKDEFVVPMPDTVTQINHPVNKQEFISTKVIHSIQAPNIYLYLAKLL